MDKLKAVLEAKRKSASEVFEGKKYVKRSEIEQAELQKLREEEQKEEAKKAATRKTSTKDAAETDKANQKQTKPANPLPQLKPEEVIRRLRVLGEPVTLFGETEELRATRLLLAEQNLHVEDEAAGGQQANIHLEIQKEEQARRKRAKGERDADVGQASSRAAEKAAKEKSQLNKDKQDGDNEDGPADEPEQDPEEKKLMEAFASAAEALAEKNMSSEEFVAKYFKRWLTEWEREIDSTPESDRSTAEYYQGSLRFKETKEYFKPLFSRLRSKSIDPEMLVGLKLITEAMRDRNYLHAYKIYMGIAIGNSPWPIGVTHVGLHERSAREKISFKYATGAAHILNDEATRKYIQATKRLLSYVQRRWPTDPSRCADFDGLSGVTPHGVMEANQLPAAPLLFETHKWDDVLKHGGEKK